jgi:hypothetical protein
MAAYEEALSSLSSQLCLADQQPERVPLPLVVADMHPGLFQQHVLPFLDRASKRALNASCQLASTHVRPAVNTITFNPSTVQPTTTTRLADIDPAIRYPAVSTLRLNFRYSTFGSPENLLIVRRVAKFTQLLRQLKHLHVDLKHMDGVDEQGWWLELVDSIVTHCAQLQSFTVTSSTHDSYAVLCWAEAAHSGPQPSQPLHQQLAGLATVQMPRLSEAMLLAQSSVQSLSAIKLWGGELVARILPGLTACKALEWMEVCLWDYGEGVNAVAKAALGVAVGHATLQHATIQLTGCHPVFDRNNQDDQAMLLELATSDKDLHIHLEAADSGADYVASNLMPLCNTPSVHSLSLHPGEQQEHLCTSHSWKHFSLLRSLRLTDVLLDDSCVAALNCMTLLEVLKLIFIKGPGLRKSLTRTIELPCLQEFFAGNWRAGPNGPHGVSDAASWQGSSSVTEKFFLAENLLRMLRTPQLHSISLEADGVVTVQTFLQLQQRSPLLLPEQCDVAVLVEDTQLAAVAENCPWLLSSGRCRFKSITHYGLMSTALTTGPSIKELCGAGVGGNSKDYFLPTLAIPAMADDSSILVLAQHCTNLTKLQLHSTSNAFTKQSILHIAAHLPLLKVLELLGCRRLDDSCLLALARGCPELDHLSLDGLGSVSEAAICASLGSLQRLDSVALDGAGQFTTRGLQSLLSGSKTLQHVFLRVGASALEAEIRQMGQEQLDGWGAGKITRRPFRGTLHVQRVLPEH